MMEVVFGARTDVGLKRKRNEDCLCVDPELGLFVVCDGLGGRDAGEVASRLAVEVMLKHVQEAKLDESVAMVGAYDPRFSPRTNRLASAIRLANLDIVRAAHLDPAQTGMATTVVSALVDGEVLSVAHVGDSRMYLLRSDRIQALTADHSLVAEQVRNGMMTEEEAASCPQKNIVTRALGIGEHVDVELDELQLLDGDKILLCSDGLTRGVKPEAILHAVRDAPDPQAACERMIELATAAGGEDNTTVVLISIHSDQQGGWWRRLARWWND